ncbi:hypothetical protein HLB44_19885 [Aquincola sp. S2]|uniref:Solute-binding protein family 3/N-terminal domain-containing protein n=1 Tax=Pseudaquabacterium terrae TaxID=2732868 RepID=A0ABX2EL25_9BURK|nr:hypothetical protein [Aquabacterium terrae]NRF69262.1 hypothetical protein [Aquabacterium terrae]
MKPAVVPRLLLGGSLLCLAMACPARTIKVCIPANPFPPLTFPDREGQGQWLVRKAVERQGDAVEFEAVPWVRCTDGVAAGTYDVAMPPSAHAAFLPTMAFPMAAGQVDQGRAVGSVTLVALRRVGSRAYWDGTSFSGLTTPVMFNKGVVTVREKLARLGVPGDEGASANESLLNKLLLGRGEILVLNAQQAAEEVASDEFRGKLEILPTPFLSFTLHAAFNRKFQAAQPAYVEAIWTEIGRLRASPEWSRVAPTLAK